MSTTVTKKSLKEPFNKKPKVVVTIQDHELPFIEFFDKGVRRSFHTNHEELLRYLEESTVEVKEDETKNNEVVLRSPALPLNTVKYGQRSNSASMLFMVSPETAYDVSYHGTTFKDVPFPNLIFYFEIINGYVNQRKVVAYKDKFLREPTQLFQFPYSNVHHGGNMCYYDKTEVKDLVQLQTFPYLWASEPNNDHLYMMGRSNQLQQPLREVFAESQGKPFDYNILTSLNTTFEEWSENILR